MTPLITKEQVKKWNSKLPEHISDADINTHILDAQEYDIISVFPDALLRAIETQILTRIQQWNRNKTYAEGNAVWYGADRKYYLALGANTDSPPPSSDWEDFELMNFYIQYLEPLHAFSAYYRFIGYHGLTVAQAGLVKATDPQGTFESVSSAERATMLGDISSKKNVWTGKISKKLNAVDYTFDGVKYAIDEGEASHIRQRPQIFQVSSKRDRYKYKDGRDRYE